MHRFWIVLAILGAGNLLMAAALTFWLPERLASAETETHRRDLRTYFTISPDQTSFERRVQSIVRRELQQPLDFTRNPIPPPFTRTARQEQLRNPLGNTRADTPPGRMTPLERRVGEEATAILTPFGVYQSGPVGIGLVLLSLCVLLIGSGMSLYLMPYRLRVLRDTLSTSWQRRLRLSSLGLLGYLIAILLMFVLVTLIVDFPFAVMLLLALSIVTFVSLVSVSLALGSWLSHRLNLPVTTPLAHLSLGTLVLFPVGLIPLLGWAAMLAISFLGFGAMLATKFGTQEGWSLDPLQKSDYEPLG